MKYKFCHQLKNSLFFSNNEILHCCPGVAEFAPKFLCNYFGNLFDKMQIINEKKYASLKSKNGQIPYLVCENCHKYEEQDWDEDFRIKDISISHWTACNCNCTYCFTSIDKQHFNSKPTYKIMPVLENIKDIIDFDGIVRFVGGDISQLDEFEDIINFFYSNGSNNF
ncbi:hypothetical protein IJG14_06775, partial [bacterium]|nr:hypothetical protein [bacterium]